MMSDRAWQGFLKQGELWIPGFTDGEVHLPPFSKIASKETLQIALRPLPKRDIKDLNGLLQVLAFLPRPLLAGFSFLLDVADHLPGKLGISLRQARMGLRGLIFGVYYSHEDVCRAIGYEPKIYMGDQPQSPAFSDQKKDWARPR